MVLELFEATIDSVLTLRPATKSTEVANPEKPVVLFIHGYPDDETLWTKNLTPSLLRDYRALLVRLPHYGGLNPKYSKWGFNFGAIAEMVAATIRAHVPEKSGPVHLVTGDWGSMVGLVLQDSFPQLVKSIVLIDVGPVFSFGVPTSEEIRTILGFRYMYILITAFLIAHFVPFIGEPVARYLCGLVFNGFHITELKVHDEDYIKKKFTPFSNYFYFYLHFNMLKRWFGAIPVKKGKGLDEHLVPSCPTFFIHGAKKPFKFCIDSKWDKKLLASPQKHWFKEADAFHWIQWEIPEEFNKDLGEWLGKNT